MFRRATRGIVSVRAFRDNGSNEGVLLELLPGQQARDHLLNVAEDDARRAAQAPFPVVFCPPPCTFKNEHRAKEEDVAEGLVITAELDRQPGQAREKLIEIFSGRSDPGVKSGGRWKNDSGKIEDKLHLHWRLAQPAIGADNLAKLKRARSLVSRLVGGDMSCDPVCHPVRWPGSWHRKAEPRLCQIVVQCSVTKLDTALEALIAAATAAGISEELQWPIRRPSVKRATVRQDHQRPRSPCEHPRSSGKACHAYRKRRRHYQHHSRGIGVHGGRTRPALPRALRQDPGARSIGKTEIRRDSRRKGSAHP